MDEPKLGVYQAINKVMLALCEEGIGKDRENTTQRFNFRGIDDVYNVCCRIVAQNNLVIIPKYSNHKRECVQTANGKPAYFSTVDAEFRIVCSTDGSSESMSTVGEAMDSGDKATNKAMSAAHKYAYIQLFAIPTEGDNDADATTHVLAPEPPVDPAVKSRVDELMRRLPAEERKELNKWCLRTFSRDYPNLRTDDLKQLEGEINKPAPLQVAA